MEQDNMAHDDMAHDDMAQDDLAQDDLANDDRSRQRKEVHAVAPSPPQGGPPNLIDGLELPRSSDC
jgi:hypothetical protein